ncbi:hypothetical protein L1987_43319 [Smallanthus sonchifolius]|uniref:Uncharacterized protein n=1 Tax=Smallanthus sonchifolius TaxID=185202 RepID=A0ACB9GKR8_9ASTR|nr:hypothetical protein L1987_43319 [Smallanthus sonchifolius]
MWRRSTGFIQVPIRGSIRFTLLGGVDDIIWETEVWPVTLWPIMRSVVYAHGGAGSLIPRWQRKQSDNRDYVPSVEERKWKFWNIPQWLAEAPFVIIDASE